MVIYKPLAIFVHVDFGQTKTKIQTFEILKLILYPNSRTNWDGGGSDYQTVRIIEK